MVLQEMIVDQGQLGALTLQTQVLESLLLSPADGVTYRVASAMISSEPALRFFAIAPGPLEVLTGDIFAPTIPFVEYIERMGAWHDLELLWAGWRVFLFLCGRDDELPPGDLQPWRDDWFVPLERHPLATYLVATDQGDTTITLRRSGPQHFTASVVDAQGRPCGELLSRVSAAATLEAVRSALLGELVSIGS